MYYIQRCFIHDYKKSEIVKPSSVLSYDYMGSAEFEFGTIRANALKVKHEIDDWNVFKTRFKAHDGRGLFILCNKTQEGNVQKLIPEIISNRVQLKEPTYLQGTLDGNRDFTHKWGAWWNLSQDWYKEGPPIFFLVLGKNVAEDIRKAFKICVS